MDIDHRLISYVSEELDYLTNDWSQDIDDPSLRRSSTVLRSLLIEGQLMKVVNMLNEEISVMAPLISKHDDGSNYYKDTQNNKVPNHRIINKHNLVNACSFSRFKVKS